MKIYAIEKIQMKEIIGQVICDTGVRIVILPEFENEYAEAVGGAVDFVIEENGDDRVIRTEKFVIQNPPLDFIRYLNQKLMLELGLSLQAENL